MSWGVTFLAKLLSYAVISSRIAFAVPASPHKRWDIRCKMGGSGSLFVSTFGLLSDNEISSLPHNYIPLSTLSNIVNNSFWSGVLCIHHGLLVM